LHSHAQEKPEDDDLVPTLHFQQATTRMKYAIVIPDGCADEPLEQLGGQTPLQAARIPGMDEIACRGVVGRANNVPAHLTPGSDVATLSLMGYDPNKYFTGRAPLEAAAQGIQLGPDDWAIRCNLVTIQDQMMRDFTAGHISNDEARSLLVTAQSELGGASLEFVPGVSYRNLLLYRGSGGPAPFSMETRSTPPHDLTDQRVVDHYPRGPGSDLLNQLMERSIKLFAEHPVNVSRRSRGKSLATNVWLWGIGQAPRLPSFQQLHGLQGKMITAVDLLRGIAAIIGWDRIEVPGATGYTDTDYAAKGRYAIEALDSTDIICVHVEATDEASHEGDAEAKVRALEAIDQHIVRPLHAALASRGEYRILVSPDHPTPIRTKTHSHGFVPFTIAGTGISPDEFSSYDEDSAGRSGLGFPEGWRLMDYFINGNS
jgi:2,3-bisphosphoglycerate-independent phosphoglycerate mutase